MSFSRTDSKSIMRMKSGQMFAKEDLLRGRKLLHDGAVQLKNSAGRLKGLLVFVVVVFCYAQTWGRLMTSLSPCCRCPCHAPLRCVGLSSRKGSEICVCVFGQHHIFQYSIILHCKMTWTAHLNFILFFSRTSAPPSSLYRTWSLERWLMKNEVSCWSLFPHSSSSFFIIAHIYTHIYVYINIYVCICIYVQYVYMYVFIYNYIYIYTYIQTYTYIHIYTLIYTHTYIYTYIYMYTYDVNVWSQQLKSEHSKKIFSQ